MRTRVLTAAMALISFQAYAQTTASTAPPRDRDQGPGAADVSLATPAGMTVNVSVHHYTYVEPGAQSISISGPKFGGEYTGTRRLSRRRFWFAQADVRGTVGDVSYDGWCYPWVITPNGASPNGYELGVGAASPCGESGDSDWYVDARGLVGKDLIGRKWAVSPSTGLGLRHLSNGTAGIAGYRTDDYLYLPLAATVRTKAAPRHVLSFTLEYDRLLHGWQKTRDSEFGGGEVPATATAPAFTIDGFSDVSFSQHGGWALRASASYQVARRWSVEPYYIRWHVSPSPPNAEAIAFTVNGITVQEQLGFYEPLNVTNEFGVKLGLRFGR